MTDDVFSNRGIEITFKAPEDFLKIKETLTRIGIASNEKKTLTQSCHLLHKRGKYAILHFKEMFSMDGKSTDFSESDRARRNTIVLLLKSWGLLDIIDLDKAQAPVVASNLIKVISHKEKGDWTLVAKYTVGKKSGRQKDSQSIQNSSIG